MEAETPSVHLETKERLVGVCSPSISFQEKSLSVILLLLFYSYISIKNSRLFDKVERKTMMKRKYNGKLQCPKKKKVNMLASGNSAIFTR